MPVARPKIRHFPYFFRNISMRPTERSGASLSLFIFVGIGIDLVDLDGRKFLDIETFPAVITDLLRIKVADLAFHATVALFSVLKDAHFPFHALIIVRLLKKSKKIRKNF